jgi:hypothetical protein
MAFGGLIPPAVVLLMKEVRQTMLLSKLKACAGVLLSAALVGLVADLSPPARNVAAQAPAEPQRALATLEQLEKVAAVIRPRPEENKWQQIPWLTDVSEGRRLAKEENRPICLVVIFGELLDEC